MDVQGLSMGAEGEFLYIYPLFAKYTLEHLNVILHMFLKPLLCMDFETD